MDLDLFLKFKPAQALINDFCAVSRSKSLRCMLWIFKGLEFLSETCWKLVNTVEGPWQALEAYLPWEVQGLSLAWWPFLSQQDSVPLALCSLCHSWPALGLWRNTCLARARFSHGQEAVGLGTHSLVGSNDKAVGEKTRKSLQQAASP